MFWKYNNTNSNHIDTLLNCPEITLQELMDEEDILQECKSQNKKLIEFLCRPEIIEHLVTLITEEPCADIDEKTRFKYPNIACELLTSDVAPINERLASSAAMEKLYGFLEGEPPLNPLLASFFSKTVGVLVARKSEQNWYLYQITCLKALEFFRSNENSVSLLLNHLGTSAIMDLMLKLMTQIEGAEIKKNLLTWFEMQKVIPSLIALLSPSVDSERHCNVSQLLCDFIRKSRENLATTSEPDPILMAVESPETIALLLDHMLSGNKSETSIVGGISVLLTLIETVRPREPDVASYSTECTTNNAGWDEVPLVVHNTTAAILPRLKDFHDLLLNPPQKPAVKTTVGTLDPPFGNTRLQITRLVSALVATNIPAVNQELANLGTIEVLLDLFFIYQWNNFLHTQVEQCLAHALSKQTLGLFSGDGEPANSVLIEHILGKCQLLKRILDAWEENKSIKSNDGNQRSGYMGHVIKIANHIAQQLKNECLAQMITEKVPPEIVEQFTKFVSSDLEEVNKTHNIILGGKPPVQVHSMDKEEVNYKYIPFPGDDSQQQAFTDYQIQEMAPTFNEDYGYHDHDFNDAEDTLHSSVDLPVMAFGLNDDDEEDVDRRSELFVSMCAKKMHTLEDAEKFAWGDTEQLGSFHDSENPSRKEGHENSSSDEEEHEDDNEKEDGCIRRPQKTNVHMDVDPTIDIWSSGAATIERVSDLSNPWNSGSPSERQTDAGWADFSAFETNFSSSTQLNEIKQSEEEPSPSQGLKPGEAQNIDETNVPEHIAASVESVASSSEVDMTDLPGDGAAAPLSDSPGVSFLSSDANANPTTCIEDVTPTATAIINEVATAAVAAVRVVVADKIELDNQRFLEGVRHTGEDASTKPEEEEEQKPSSSEDSMDKSDCDGSFPDDVPSEAV